MIDIGNLLIGLGVLITTISAILFKIKYIRNKCASCYVTEKSFDKDIEEARQVANEAATVVPRAIWCNIGEALKKTLTPKEIKVAETILETIEHIGEENKVSNDK
jgi:hypothetical protein